jgi:SHS2 domain-containing protein
MDTELRAYGQSRTERLMEAAYALLDASGEGRDGVLKAKDRLRKAGG